MHCWGAMPSSWGGVCRTSMETFGGVASSGKSRMLGTPEAMVAKIIFGRPVPRGASLGLQAASAP